jgi:glutamine amidotransferase-like uncharacterized protein
MTSEHHILLIGRRGGGVYLNLCVGIYFRSLVPLLTEDRDSSSELDKETT